jgi:outer membrane protein assembly factor BamB
MHGSRRVAVLTIAVLVILGVGGYVAYRSPLVRGWFDRDADDESEKDRAAAAETRQSDPPAPPTLGWPQWRGPLRDGRAPEGAFRTDWDKRPPTQLWKTECGGGYSSLAVVGGKVYTQDRQGDRERVICLDAESGKGLWNFGYAADYAGMDRTYAQGPRATPTIDGNRLYAMGAAGKFICLDISKAPDAAVWEHDTASEFRAKLPQWGIACSPLVEGDLVIVQPGGRDGSVVAFDKMSGDVRWKAGSEESGYSSPIAATIGGVRVFYAMTAKSLICIRAGDGAILDQQPWLTQHGGNIATPVVLKDYVFISSGYGKGCALFRADVRGESAKLVRVYNRAGKVMQNHHSTCVFKDGFLYGYDDSRLRCVDFAKGIEKEGWDADVLQGKGSVILAGNHLIVLTERGELGLVEATSEEFRFLARLPSGLNGSQNWTLPVLVDGRLYLRDNQKVICLDIRP